MEKIVSRLWGFNKGEERTTDKSTSRNPNQFIPIVLEESASTDIAVESPKVELVDDLKLSIVYLIHPKRCFHLSLVNKTMRSIVDRTMNGLSMCLEASVYKGERGFYKVTLTKDDQSNHRSAWDWKFMIAPSSVPSLFHHVGICVTSLCVKPFVSWNDLDRWLEKTPSVFEALIVNDDCPNLKRLEIDGDIPSDAYEILLHHLLEYVKKRQLKADVASPEPRIPFLESLRLHVIFSGKLETDQNPSPKEMDMLKGQTRDLLQQVLDQCEGLKVLSVGELLDGLGLPLTALRYPATLTQLKIKRDEPNLGCEDLPAIASNCPKLQSLELFNASQLSNEAVHSLASLSDLRELAIESDLNRDNSVELIEFCLSAFGKRPFGASIGRPLLHLNSVLLKWCSQGITNFSLSLRGRNSFVTSLTMETYECFKHDISCLNKVLEALNRNAIPQLKKLTIEFCFFFDTPSNSTEENNRAQVLDELLDYVKTKQSLVKSGTPFLQSLSLIVRPCFRVQCRVPITEVWRYRELLNGISSVTDKIDERDRILNMLQQILAQCHGLKKLNAAGLLTAISLPMTALRYPTTLKHLTTLKLSKSSEEFNALINSYPNLETIKQRNLRDIYKSIRFGTHRKNCKR